MKKVILLLLAIVALVSCEKYCPICDRYGDCTCGNRDGGYSYGVNYQGDYFCAEKLLGTWQCNYTTIVGNMTIKSIKFVSNRKCDITYSLGRNTEWYTDTFNYTFSSGYLRFSGVANFSFCYRGYIFPELYLEDSNGRYTWRKTKSYGC